LTFLPLFLTRSEAVWPYPPTPERISACRLNHRLHNTQLTPTYYHREGYGTCRDQWDRGL